MCYNQGIKQTRGVLMNLIELHSYAEKNDIIVNYRKIDAKKACVLKLQSKFHILLNQNLVNSESEERIILAHELGHCENDQLYYLTDYSNPMYVQNILKSERMASDYACMLLASVDEIKTALSKYEDEYSAAESLNINVLKFKEIVDCYKRKGFL